MNLRNNYIEHWTKANSMLKNVYRNILLDKEFDKWNLTEGSSHSEYILTIEYIDVVYKIKLLPFFQFINLYVFYKHTGVNNIYSGLGYKHSIVHTIYNFLIDNIKMIPSMTDFQKEWFCNYYKEPSSRLH